MLTAPQRPLCEKFGPVSYHNGDQRADYLFQRQCSEVKSLGVTGLDWPPHLRPGDIFIGPQRFPLPSTTLCHLASAEAKSVQLPGPGVEHSKF